MSLILEALRKLEREKQAPERGVVVLAPAAWSGVAAPRRSLIPWAAGGAALALAVVVAYAALRDRPDAPETVAAPSTAAAPVAAAAPGAEPAAVRAADPVAPDGSGRSSGPSAGASRATVAAPSSTASAADPAVPFRAPVADPPASGRDRAHAAPPSPSRLRLLAISERDGEPVALVNDRVVRVGEIIDGAKVVAIGTSSIDVEVDGERRQIGF